MIFWQWKVESYLGCFYEVLFAQTKMVQPSVRTVEERVYRPPHWMRIFMRAVHGSESLTPALPVNALKSPPPPPLTTLCMCASVCVYVCLNVSDNVCSVLKQEAACNMHPSWAFSCSKSKGDRGGVGLHCQLKKSPSSNDGCARNQWQIETHRCDTHHEHLTQQHFTAKRDDSKFKVLGKDKKSPRITSPAGFLAVRVCRSPSCERPWRATISPCSHNNPIIIYSSYYNQQF